MRVESRLCWLENGPGRKQQVWLAFGSEIRMHWKKLVAGKCLWQDGKVEQSKEKTSFKNALDEPWFALVPLHFASSLSFLFYSNGRSLFVSFKVVWQLSLGWNLLESCSDGCDLWLALGCVLLSVWIEFHMSLWRHVELEHWIDKMCLNWSRAYYVCIVCGRARVCIGVHTLLLFDYDTKRSD